MVHTAQSGLPIFGEELLISSMSMLQPVGHSRRVLTSLYKLSHQVHPQTCLSDGRQEPVATWACVTALATNNPWAWLTQSQLLPAPRGLVSLWITISSGSWGMKIQQWGGPSSGSSSLVLRVKDTEMAVGLPGLLALRLSPSPRPVGHWTWYRRGGPVKTSSPRLSASCTFTWSCTRPFGGISSLGKGWIQVLKCKLAQLSTVVVSCCAKLLCHLVGVAWSIESRGHPGCLWPLHPSLPPMPLQRVCCS